MIEGDSSADTVLFFLFTINFTDLRVWSKEWEKNRKQHQSIENSQNG